MIVIIRLTDEAVKHLQQVTGLGPEEAEEAAQMIINLSEKTVSPTPKYKKEKELLRELQSVTRKYEGEETFDTFVKPHALQLFAALEQYFEEAEIEGNKTYIRIIDTSRELVEAKKGIKTLQDWHRVEGFIDELEILLKEWKG